MRGRFRLDLNEISGSFGDLAIFLPLAIGLVTVNGVNATSLFLSAGLLYIVAGLYYGIPIPVQPLKATSAIAIVLAVRPEAISAAAFWMGVLFVSVSLFNINALFGKIFTRPIVRGIQLGLGILLVKGGLSALFGSTSMLSLGGWKISPVFGALVGAAVAGIIVLSRENRRYPAALAVMAFGIAVGGASTSFAALSSVSLGWIRPEWGIPAGADFYTVFIVLLLPQIPLTFANSVVATADTADRYYGEGARKVTPRALAATLGIGNLFAGLIGGMPVCHGSGGVTAHYRFGARTGAASVFIGGMFVLLALLFGKSLPDLCRLLPIPVLGALLIHIGVQHARLVRDVLDSAHESAVVAAIGLVTLATGNLAIAFGGGILLNAIIARLLWRSASRKAAQGMSEMGGGLRNGVG
jgi:MFS superfamily sulfate permease-like transporter